MDSDVLKEARPASLPEAWSIHRVVLLAKMRGKCADVEYGQGWAIWLASSSRVFVAFLFEWSVLCCLVARVC